MTKLALVVEITGGAALECPELTRAVNAIFSGYEESVRPLLHRWLRPFVCNGPETAKEFIHEPPADTRNRLEAMLRRAGCTWRPGRNGQRGLGYLVVERPHGNAGEISVFLCALTDFYGYLAEKAKRTEANPMLVELPHGTNIPSVTALQANRRKSHGHKQHNWLSRYTTRTSVHLPPPISDPCGVVKRLREFIEYLCWPVAALLLFDLLAETGCRISEACDLTAWHWWAGSRFGRVIQAPNRKNKRKRDKNLVPAEAYCARLTSQFEDRSPNDPAMPNLSRLREIAREDPEALRAIPLFPNRNGAPLSPTSFRNTYFAPAVRAAGIMVLRSDGSSKRPGPHLLRHADITRAVSILDQMYPNDADFKRELIGLAKTYGCSEENIYRYATAFMEKRGLARQLKIADAQRTVTLDALKRERPSVVEERVARMKARNRRPPLEGTSFA